MKPPYFFTDSGKEVPALTTAQMREVDRIAIQETGPNLFQMMENAGRSLAEMALERLGGDWQNARIVVLAGTGGNGGGGITAARHLASHGARVELCLAVPERLSEVAAWQRKVFQSTSGKEVEFRNLDPGPVRLILDALVGYGLESAPEGVFAALIRWANGTRIPIISLDVPSGRDSTTGATPGEFIWPSWTMTLALPKTGLAQQGAGELVLADIGIPEETYRRIGVSYFPLSETALEFLCSIATTQILLQQDSFWRKLHGETIGRADSCLQDAADGDLLILTDDQVDEKRRSTGQIDWSAATNHGRRYFSGLYSRFQCVLAGRRTSIQ